MTSLLTSSLRSLSLRSPAPAPSASAILRPSASSSSSFSPRLQQRSIVVLQNPSNLKSNFGARKDRTMVARGQASQTGNGKGQGNNGQNARAGKGAHRAFEGGQTPITLQHPKYGFKNVQRKYYQPIPLQTIQDWIDLKRLDPTEVITVEHILKSNICGDFNEANGFKVLAKGFEKLKQPIHIRAHRCSQKAILAIEAAGGSVTCVYHNRESFAQACNPENYTGHLRIQEALPLKKRDILFYTNWANRGYLARKPEGWKPARTVPKLRFKHPQESPAGPRVSLDKQ